MTKEQAKLNALCNACAERAWRLAWHTLRDRSDRRLARRPSNQLVPNTSKEARAPKGPVPFSKVYDL